MSQLGSCNNSDFIFAIIHDDKGITSSGFILMFNIAEYWRENAMMFDTNIDELEIPAGCSDLRENVFEYHEGDAQECIDHVCGMGYTFDRSFQNYMEQGQQYILESLSVDSKGKMVSFKQTVAKYINDKYPECLI